VRRPELAVGLALLALFGGMVVAASSYPAAARLLPLIVGIPALALTAWELRAQWRVAAPTEPDAATARLERRAQGVAFVWFVAFVLAIVAGGFSVGGVAAVVVAQRFWLRESWRTSLIGGAVAFAVLFAGIDRGLGQPLFEGVVTAWVRRWLGI